MAVSTSTTVAATIYAKVLETLIAMYQYDDATAVPFFRYKSIIGEFAPVASFPRFNKDSTPSVANETTSLTPTTWTMTSFVDITVGRVGIAREISATAEEDSILGRSMRTDIWVKDAGRLYGEQLDTDGTALFGSITASVGSTGVALTIAALVAGMASQRANKARGAQVVHLHDLQVKQLQQAQVASTATPWATFYAPNADSTQFAGYFMGAPVWSSSKNPTANAAADRVGAIWTQGQNMPAFSGLALVVKRQPSSLELADVLQDANIWASFMRYGVGIPANNFCTKIISQNA
jgi:hypothetical protein